MAAGHSPRAAWVAGAAAVLGLASIGPASVGAAFTDEAAVEGVAAVGTAELPELAVTFAAIDTASPYVGFLWDTPELADHDDFRYRVSRTAAGVTEEVEVATAALGDSTLAQDVVAIGRLLVPAALESISVGYEHSCGIANGVAYCWGSNDYGQLGTGAPGPRSGLPHRIGGVLEGMQVTAISAGDRLTCAIADGDAYCWGRGDGGRLGDGSEHGGSGPVAVHPAWEGAEVTAVDATGDGTACVIAGGDVYCWGANDRHQLGDATTLDRSSPVPVRRDHLGEAEVTRIALNAHGACAIADGELFCWGDNYASWADESVMIGASVPTPLSSASPLAGREITGLEGAEQRFCAVADGTVYCWGLAGAVHFGVEADADPRARALPAPLGDPAGALDERAFTEVSMGFYVSCAWGDGVPVCWGDSYSGASGTGISLLTGEERYVVPSPISVGELASLTNIASLDVGRDMACLLADEGPVCWGIGVFGDGQEQNIAPEPVIVDLSETLGEPSCPAGWLIDDDACVPAAGTTVSYELAYEVRGWSSPAITRHVTWAEDAR